MSQPADSVPRALGHLRVALEDAYLRASRAHGLTAPQAELLCAAMQPAAVGRLAHALRCDRTNVTHLVDRAVQRGWIERQTDERDRRSSVIALTPAGDRLAHQFIRTLESQLEGLLERWPEPRQRDAAAMLHEIAGELDRAPGASSDDGAGRSR